MKLQWLSWFVCVRWWGETGTWSPCSAGPDVLPIHCLCSRFTHHTSAGRWRGRRWRCGRSVQCYCFYTNLKINLQFWQCFFYGNEMWHFCLDCISGSFNAYSNWTVTLSCGWSGWSKFVMSAKSLGHNLAGIFTRWNQCIAYKTQRPLVKGQGHCLPMSRNCVCSITLSCMGEFWHKVAGMLISWQQCVMLKTQRLKVKVI